MTCYGTSRLGLWLLLLYVSLLACSFLLSFPLPMLLLVDVVYSTMLGTYACDGE